MIRSAARIPLPSSQLIKIVPALHLTCAALAYFSSTNRTPVHAATLDRDPAISRGTTFGGTGSWTNTAPLNWWNGTADRGWTDMTGVDVAVLSGSSPGTVTIPRRTTIVGNGLTFCDQRSHRRRLRSI